MGREILGGSFIMKSWTTTPSPIAVVAIDSVGEDRTRKDLIGDYGRWVLDLYLGDLVADGEPSSQAC